MSNLGNLKYGWEPQDCGYKTACWIWRGRLAPNGYAYTAGGSAHRRVYEALRGAVSEGLVLDHLCRVPACVNPDHLEPVTQGENSRRGTNAKLNWDAVHAIRASAETQRVLAARYGVSETTISAIQLNKRWVESDVVLREWSVMGDRRRRVLPDVT